MKRMPHFVVAVLIALGVTQLVIADAKDEELEVNRFAVALKHVDELIGIEKLDEAVELLEGLDANTLKNAAKIDYRLGKAFLRLDRPSTALDYFERATFSTIDDGEIYVGLAEANLALGNLVRARRYARTALRTNNDLMGAHVVLATIDDRSGQVTIAKERFADLLINHPNNELALLAYARFLSHRNDLDEAITLLTSYLDRLPYAAEASDLLGLLHWAKGQRTEAFKYRAIAAKAFKSKGNDFRAEQISTWIMANDRDGVFRSENHPQVKRKAPPCRIRYSHVGCDDGPHAKRKILQEAPRRESGPRTPSSPSQVRTLRQFDPLPFAQGDSVSTGTGFIVNGGKYVITNRHVIDGTGKLAVRSGTGEVRLARVESIAEHDDLAILELQDAYPETYSVPLQTSEEPRPGMFAVVMGFPMAGILGWQHPSLTEGIVSKDSGLRDNPTTFLLTSKMNKGNSGGPIFDRKGNLIGVVVAKLSVNSVYEETGDIPEDVNIGIKASRVLNFLKQPTKQANGGSPVSLEDLYQIMLSKVVLVVGEVK